MWRSFLAVLLLPTLTAAQAAPEVQPGFSPHTVDAILGPPHSGNASRSSYQSYTRHTGIRRGSEEDVGILLTTGGFITAASSPVPGVVQLKLEFEPLDGFTINEVQGPKVYKSNFKVQGESVKVSAGAYMQFKIRAERNTAPGTHVLKGRFTFQKLPMDGSAMGPVEQVDVQTPLTVVDQDAKVQKADFPYGPLPGWQTFLFVISIPVLIVLLIPLLLLCTVTGTCPEC